MTTMGSKAGGLDFGALEAKLQDVDDE